MNPECDDRVQLSKSDKNISAGGWWVDNIFEATDSGDVLAHPRITNTHTHTQVFVNIKQQNDYLNMTSVCLC